MAIADTILNSGLVAVGGFSRPSKICCGEHTVEKGVRFFFLFLRNTL